MDTTIGIIIAMLLGAQTIISSIAVKLLMSRLDRVENSTDHAHDRVSDHVREFHTIRVG